MALPSFPCFRLVGSPFFEFAVCLGKGVFVKQEVGVGGKALSPLSLLHYKIHNM